MKGRVLFIINDRERHSIPRDDVRGTRLSGHVSASGRHRGFFTLEVFLSATSVSMEIHDPSDPDNAVTAFGDIGKRLTELVARMVADLTDVNIDLGGESIDDVWRSDVVVTWRAVPLGWTRSVQVHR